MKKENANSSAVSEPVFERHRKPELVNHALMPKVQDALLPAKYCSAQRMLEEVFDERSRPSMRWLRAMTASRKIPFRKCGGKVLFLVEEVKQAIESQAQGKGCR